MSITIRSLKCPECNADLQIEEGRNECYCTYCGAKIAVHRDDTITVKIIDEIGENKADIEKTVKLAEIGLKEMEKKEQGKSENSLRLTQATIALGAFVLIGFIIWIMNKTLGAERMSSLSPSLFLMFGMLLIGGAYWLFNVFPAMAESRRAATEGGIHFPRGLEPFTKHDYEHIRRVLSDAGFNNITCVNMHDLKIGLLHRQGKVISVQIGGRQIFSGGQAYHPNVPITITYHGK